jgi:hypothetical protein
MEDFCLQAGTEDDDITRLGIEIFTMRTITNLPLLGVGGKETGRRVVDAVAARVVWVVLAVVGVTDGELPGGTNTADDDKVRTRTIPV